MLSVTVIGSKAMLNYAELCALLTRVALILNNSPLRICWLTKEDNIPVTPNQLLLGRTSKAQRMEYMEEDYHHDQRFEYVADLLKTWWAQYTVQAFHSLIPYQQYKDAKRHKTLQEGKVCLLPRCTLTARGLSGLWMCT